MKEAPDTLRAPVYLRILRLANDLRLGVGGGPEEGLKPTIGFAACVTTGDTCKSIHIGEERPLRVPSLRQA